MKHLSLLSVVGAVLCIFWACDPVDSDEPENGKNNGQGNINDSVQITVDWSDPDWYSVNYWDRTDRQKAGLRGPVKKWHIDNYTTYFEYEYDAAGHLVRKAYFNTQNEGSNYEWLYSYDAQGHCIKAEYFDVFCEDGKPSEYWVYEYENTGKYVAREWFMMGPRVSNAETAICKDLSKASHVKPRFTCNLCTEEKSYEELYDFAYAYENGYPSKLKAGTLTFQIDTVTYYPNGMYKDFVYLEKNSYNYDTGWDRHSYTMLDNPRYLEVDTFSLGGTYSYMSLTPQHMKKTYDSHFDIVKNEEWYESTTPNYTDTWVNYTYDRYGNWVTRDETVIARLTSQPSATNVNRVMEYFE